MWDWEKMGHVKPNQEEYNMGKFQFDLVLFNGTYNIACEGER